MSSRRGREMIPTVRIIVLVAGSASKASSTVAFIAEAFSREFQVAVLET